MMASFLLKSVWRHHELVEKKSLIKNKNRDKQNNCVKKQNKKGSVSIV